MIIMEYLGPIVFYPIESIEGKKEKNNQVIIPVYGKIPCGLANYIDDELNGHLEIPAVMLGEGDYYVLKAKGDSMIDAGIFPGDLVVIKKQNYAEQAQIVVAFVDGETTLKRYFSNSTTQIIELRPENKKFSSLFVKNCTILGVAVKIIRDLE